MLNDAASWAQIISAALFVGSLWIAIRAMVIARQTQKRATATELWDVYLARAIQYPEFAFPPKFESDFDFAKQEFKGSRRRFEQYEWFVSALLETADEILREFDNSDHRISLVQRNIRYHAAYLKTKWNAKNPQVNFLGDLGAQAREIIESVIAPPRGVGVRDATTGDRAQAHRSPPTISGSGGTSTPSARRSVTTSPSPPAGRSPPR